MARNAVVSATYQSDEFNQITVTVSIPATFPDCVDEARTQAVRGVTEVLADIVGEVEAEQ